MKTLVLDNSTLLYILPAIVFLVVGVMWFVTVWLKSATVSRVLGLIPIWTVYGAFGLLLFAGGLHRIYHVRLDGVEMDFARVDTQGNKENRELIIGGWDEEGEDPALFVRGYPARALKLEFGEGKMRLVPGEGYRRDLLVRSGNRLVPMKGRVPALVPLEAGDEIIVSEAAGGGEIIRKVIGAGTYDLTPRSGTVRWIGGGGTDIVARAGGYPPQVVGVELVGQELKLLRGPGLREGTRVLVNGRPSGLREQAEVMVPYLPGRTVVELKKLDPLVGEATFGDDGLDWKGETSPVTLTFSSDVALTAGGNAFDDLYVKGLPGGALRMSVSVEGLKLVNAKEVEGLPTEWLGKPGKQLRFGSKGAAWGGVLGVLDVKSLGVSDQAREGGTDSVPPEPKEIWQVTCGWKPNEQTRLAIEKRQVTLPLVQAKVEVLTYRDWTEEVYPLAKLSARESAVRSSVVFGANGMGANDAALLVMDSGIEIRRDGKLLKWGEGSQPGEISDDAELEFLQLRSLRQKGPAGTARTALQPAEVVEPQDLIERKSLERVQLVKAPGSGKYPAVRVTLGRKETEAVDTGKIKDDAKALEDVLGGKLAFGVNDQSDWASLPHQVKFDSLTDWFAGASGEIEVNAFSFVLHDDYHRRKMAYGETFSIGGRDRLRATLDKKTVPWNVIAWLAAAALVTTVFAWSWTRTFAGSSLFFGVAFLTGSRVLFGQVAAVNYPYDGSVLRTAVIAAVALPILVAVVLFLGNRVVQGKPKELLSKLTGRNYLWYAGAAVLLMVLRLGLLLGGFKEGIPIPGVGRLALSIFFVPLYLGLFAIVFTKGQRVLQNGWSVKKLWQFVAIAAVVLGSQAASGFAVSDLGTFLYLIPPSIALAILGVWLVGRGLEKGSSVMASLRTIPAWFAGCTALALPLLAIALVLVIPGALVKISTGLVGMDLDEKYLEQGEIATGSTALRVLHFADENYLINFGTDDSEAILQDHAIMENYAHRGLRGEGYLQVNIIPVKKTTSMNDNVSAVFILGQFGAFGAAAICLAYLAILLSNIGAGNSVGDWIARLVAMTFALISLYMLAANWGLMPFTGRNMYLLGLNSNGDLLEGALLLGLLALGRSLGSGDDESGILGALKGR